MFKHSFEKPLATQSLLTTILAIIECQACGRFSFLNTLIHSKYVAQIGSQAAIKH